MAPWGGCANLGGALPDLRILCPKTAVFGPNPPRNPFKTAKRREKVATLKWRLGVPVTKSPLLPSNSTICPTDGPKMAKNSAERADFVSTIPKTKNRPYLGLRGSKPNSEGTYSTRNPPSTGIAQQNA